jgi:hypothetical protein
MGGMTGVWAIEELTAAVPEVEARWPIAAVLADVRGAAAARPFLEELRRAGVEPQPVDVHRRLLAAVPELGETFGLAHVYAELGSLVAQRRDAGDRALVARALAHVERLHADAPPALATQARTAVLGDGDGAADGWTAAWLELAGPRTLAARGGRRTTSA